MAEIEYRHKKLWIDFIDEQLANMGVDIRWKSQLASLAHDVAQSGCEYTESHSCSESECYKIAYKSWDILTSFAAVASQPAEHFLFSDAIWEHQLNLEKDIKTNFPMILAENPFRERLIDDYLDLPFRVSAFEFVLIDYLTYADLSEYYMKLFPLEFFRHISWVCSFFFTEKNAYSIMKSMAEAYQAIGMQGDSVSDEYLIFKISQASERGAVWSSSLRKLVADKVLRQRQKI